MYYIWSKSYNIIGDKIKILMIIILYVREPDGSLICRYISTVYSYYHFDNQGSTLFLTSNTGLVTDRYSYDAWGNLVTKSGSTGHPFLYVGKYGYYAHYQDEAVLPYTTASLSDKKPSFLQTGARQYFPKLGRYLQEDPVMDGLNWFVYCENNPVNYIDYTGKFAFLVTVGIVAIIGAEAYVCANYAPDYADEIFKMEDSLGIEHDNGGDLLSHCTASCAINLKYGPLCAWLAARSSERGRNPFGSLEKNDGDEDDEAANFVGFRMGNKLRWNKCRTGNDITDCMNACMNEGFVKGK